MGEAKRRRLLDPNYGLPKIPNTSEPTSKEVFKKQTDFKTVPKNHFINSHYELPKLYLKCRFIPLFCHFPGGRSPFSKTLRFTESACVHIQRMHSCFNPDERATA
ncbi:hypothetical protein COO91_10106 (plasmid) [Nostoc flagelliforme CCNUN1]|uniref:Uncharacterized protein n=1 Tax=Nostoc flagelliforme CCNUN1 TaxID=2038116 RepID=A0A2K8T870_9NOSO|nr:hypothetical protein [Nostoc flagelliforme]AUB43897.1 hypothetical protein COO91_10106 [Nostoc flagelliforme CCNUN1]